jgi:hypothetical protein
MNSLKESGRSLREWVLSDEAGKSRFWRAWSASCILFGVFGFTSIFPTYLSSVASRDWPSVTGVIEASDVQSWTGRNGTVYDARIYYKYAVNGVQYLGKRVGHADYVSTPGHAQSIISKYKKGAAVPVYYNPADPSKAVLEVGVKKFTSFSLLACLIVFSIGLFGLWRNWMNWRKPAPA